ncbi:MAG: hypothetical protein K0S08_705 [Gammaproteobacteria bacterium]|jgi:predicted RNA-binding protein|nr:hypothetical protein [Gammaproteobacteria bacterium]
MKYWIAVVSREHALRGIKEGFVQVCHGKAGPLRRMSAGDWLIFYSPKEKFGEKTVCQKFVGIGKIKDGKAYQADMGNDFKPYRMDVDFQQCQEVSIFPLIKDLSFLTDKRNWGYKFRFGHLEIPKEDLLHIAEQMGVKIDGECKQEAKRVKVQPGL